MGGIAAVVVIVGRQRVMVLWLMLLQEVGRGAEGGRRSAELRRGTGELHCPTVQRRLREDEAIMLLLMRGEKVGLGPGMQDRRCGWRW